MPLELVKDLDFCHLSSITFDEFNEVCPIINKEGGSELLANHFSSCIAKAKEEFQYPQYYNGLMGLLLLFSNDRSYELFDTQKIQNKYEEIQRLAITGYEDFDHFSPYCLMNVIKSVREMSHIFHIVHGKDPWTTANVVSRSLKKEDYFERRQGKLIQTEPIDYSKSSIVLQSNKRHSTVLDLYHLAPGLEAIDCKDRLASLLADFEKSFASVTSGFLLRTNIGIELIMLNQMF